MPTKSLMSRIKKNKVDITNHKFAYLVTSLTLQHARFIERHYEQVENMVNRKTIIITGILGLLGSIIVGLGEFLLHYSPQMVEQAEDFFFFNFVSYDSLVTGHFLAVVGIPLYFVGYYHIYKMLEKGNETLALIVLLLGVLAFTVGGFWITSRAFLGTIVHLRDSIDINIYQQIISNYELISESLVEGLRVIILAVSLFFIIAILKGGTYYKKWMAISNPIVLLLSVFLVFFINPSVGQYIMPIAMNVAHFALFSLSLYQAKNINN